MAEGKKSFILYADIIHTVEYLSDEEAGILFKLILDYVNDKNPKNPSLLVVRVAFEPIKQLLKRDLKKWEKYVEKQRANGAMGGRPLKNRKVKTQKNQALKNKSKKADSVNVNVSDNVNVIEWKNIKENFFNAYEWQEQFCREKGILPDSLQNLLHEFISNIELKEDYKDLKELKRHFTNTFNKNKNGNKATSGKPNGAQQLLEIMRQDHARRK